MELTNIKAESINDFFGSLQEAFVGTWRQHLEASSRNVHVILNEFYDELPDLVDTLIEDYMGIFGKIENFNNIIVVPKCPIEYLEKLSSLCENSKYLLQGKSELESDLDAIKSLIDSTLYKLKELTNLEDTKNLSGYVKSKLSY